MNLFSRTKVGEQTLAHAEEGLTGMEAYQRAPTLMGGESAGSHGSVLVWGPARSVVGRRLLFAAFASAYLTALFCSVAHDRSDRVGIAILLGQIPLWPLIWRSRNAPRIAVDGSGLAFSLKGKRHYAAWAQVRSIYLSEQADLHLYLRGSHVFTMDLMGYTKAARKEILDTICSSAKLQPNPVRPGWFVSVPELPPAFEAVAGEEGTGRLVELHWLPAERTYCLVCRGKAGEVQEEQFFRTRTEAMTHAREQYDISPAFWRRLRCG